MLDAYIDITIVNAGDDQSCLAPLGGRQMVIMWALVECDHIDSCAACLKDNPYRSFPWALR